MNKIEAKITQIPQLTERQINRFWLCVNKNGSVPKGQPELGQCWEWIGKSKDRKGYGRVGVNYRVYLPHRISWFLNTGKQPNSLVLHKCDNPSCVNPSHLFEGTHQDNAVDMVNKGRHVNNNGEHHGLSKLTHIEVLEIRALYTAGNNQYELAKQFGVNQSQISRIVRFQRRIKE